MGLSVVLTMDGNLLCLSPFDVAIFLERCPAFPAMFGLLVLLPIAAVLLL